MEPYGDSISSTGAARFIKVDKYDVAPASVKLSLLALLEQVSV